MIRPRLPARDDRPWPPREGGGGDFFDHNKYRLIGKRPVVTTTNGWARYLCGRRARDHRRVASTQLFPHVWISSVFLGLNHRFGGNGPPVLFETMTFVQGESRECWRACTWGECIRNHQRAINYARRCARASWPVPRVRPR